MKISVNLVNSDNWIIVEFDDVNEWEEGMPRLLARGWKPYFKGLREEVSAKVTNTIMDKLDGLEIQRTGISCPRHGTEKIFTDKTDSRKKYCGVKVEGKWCGYKWDEHGNVVKPK